MKQNLHTHTTYCDGESTPEEIILAAIDGGLDSIGFSGHAPACWDDNYCMTPEAMKKYRKEIISLRDKYASQIKIYLGIEQDYFSDPLDYPWDYIIGSVHCLMADNNFFPTDDGRDVFVAAVNKYYEGHIYECLADYYKLVSRLPQVTGCDIIGHFDLVSKYNDDGSLFDPAHPKYIEAWTTALDKIFACADAGALFTGNGRAGACLTGKPIFEINTGAMSRGVRQVPYPAMDQLCAIQVRGGRIMINSDSHHATTLDAYFDEARDLALKAGFTEQTVLTDEGFVSVPL